MPHGGCNNSHRGHNSLNGACASCTDDETFYTEDVIARTEVAIAHIEDATARVLLLSLKDILFTFVLDGHCN